MSETPKIEPHITTLDGNPDLSNVLPGEHVQFHTERSVIIFPAEKVVTADHASLHEAADGSTEMLDGSHAVKLGGALIGISEKE